MGLQSDWLSSLQLAHILYLESPVGVGYSFSDSQDYRTNDTEVGGVLVGKGVVVGVSSGQAPLFSSCRWLG